MAKFAFISRHAPAPSQIEMAKAQGIDLEHVGDADAFNVSCAFVYEKGDYEGVVVVHPAAAMKLCQDFLIGVFENATRPPVDGKPQFEAKELHVFDLRD